MADDEEETVKVEEVRPFGEEIKSFGVKVEEDENDEVLLIMENEIIQTVQSTDLKVMLNTAFEKTKYLTTSVSNTDSRFTQRPPQPMTDEMDGEIRTFIVKAAKTLSTISERRKPITQMMDSVKKYFTGLENEINVKNENVIGKLQGVRISTLPRS